MCPLLWVYYRNQMDVERVSEKSGGKIAKAGGIGGIIVGGLITVVGVTAHVLSGVAANKLKNLGKKK